MDLRHGPVTTAPALQDDLELQTDVMRFLAILALCLMAVFALVQGLPAPPVSADSAPPAEPELEALRQHNQDLERAVARARTQAQQRIQALQQRLKERERTLSRLRRRLAQVSADLTASRGALKDLRAQASPKSRPKALPPPEVRPAAAERPPERRGFNLRFADERALLRLMAGGQVRVYAREGARFWRIVPDGSGLHAQRAPAPKRYYEMTADTVPASLRATLPRRAPLWGVVLPSDLSARIARAIRGRQGGDLVILASGEVELRPEGP